MIDLRTLVPLDEACILKSVEKTGRLVVVHEAWKRGGVGGDIISMVNEKAFYSLEAPPVRVAGKNTTVPFNKNLEKLCVPSVNDIVAGVMEAING